MPAASPVPDDVRRWIDRQDAPDRESLTRAWALAGLAEDSPPTPDTAWERLAARLDAAPGARAADRPAARAPRRAVRRAVVSLGVLAVAVAAATWLRPQTVAAGGTVAAVALPDGSAVTLAPGSEVAYRRGLWGGVRRVRVEGQAFVEVAHDGRPFVAETFNAEVEVLGTAFDVVAWPSGGETAVALVEGAVRLRSPGGAVTLAPGEASRVVGRAAPTPPIRADAEAAASWRDGGFVVVDAPLAAVAAAVEGRFGRAVRLGDGVDRRRRLTLFLPAAADAEVVLRDVAAYLDLRLRATPDGYDLLTR